MSATDINPTNDVPELQAIVFASHVLKTFKDNDSRVRVLRGVCKYFGLHVNVAGPGVPDSTDEPLDAQALQQLMAAAAENSHHFTSADTREMAMSGVS
jgi:hypothetical protein